MNVKLNILLIVHEPQAQHLLISHEPQAQQLVLDHAPHAKHLRIAYEPYFRKITHQNSESRIIQDRTKKENKMYTKSA